MTARNLPEHPADPTGLQVTDLLLPTAVLRDSALRHNAELFARWCHSAGVSHAPHLKTHLAPALVSLLQAVDTWGYTVASVAQLRLAVGWGVRRAILANVVVDAPSLRLLGSLLEAHPELTVHLLADSVTAVRILEEAPIPPGRLRVLVELGLSGERTGARTVDEALLVAAAVSQSASLVLSGVESFEGLLPTTRQKQTLATIGGLFQAMADTLAGFVDLDTDEELLFTAGGSYYPDLVAETPLPTLPVPVRTVVRSGGALTHDHGVTAEVPPLAAAAHHALGALRPALEVWGWVISTPDSGRAILGLGKRDCSFDLGLPVVLGISRDGIEIPAAATVTRLTDQHAYLEHDNSVQIGDLVRLGPIHPCTTFDKWPVIPVIDDAGRVVSTVSTHF